MWFIFRLHLVHHASDLQKFYILRLHHLNTALAARPCSKRPQKLGLFPLMGGQRGPNGRASFAHSPHMHCPHWEIDAGSDGDRTGDYLSLHELLFCACMGWYSENKGHRWAVVFSTLKDPNDCPTSCVYVIIGMLKRLATKYMTQIYG